LDEVEIAMYFSAYSFIYPKVSDKIKEEKEKNSTREAVTALGRPIHRNTRMIVLINIRLFDMITDVMPHNMIKLVRRMQYQLKNHLMMRIHSYKSYTLLEKHCGGTGDDNDCTKKSNMCKRDLMQTLGVIYFILFGGDLENRSQVETYTKFAQFYEFHIKFLENQLAHYTIVL
jgi:hypothetical protein